MFTMFTVFLSRRLVREEGHISCSFLTHDIGGKAGEVAWVSMKNYFLVPIKNKGLCLAGQMICMYSLDEGEWWGVVESGMGLFLIMGHGAKILPHNSKGAS